MKDIHIIGHSLGAHIAGYAGEYVFKKSNIQIGRITGLDPASPLFNPTPDFIRLDRNDAKFVDIIHTDIPGLGMSVPIGHIDFYPNRGKNQPGCNKITNVLKACSHSKSASFFISSLQMKKDKFGGCICSHHRNIKYRHCINCIKTDDSPKMGIEADEFKNIRNDSSVIVFLKTRKHYPFYDDSYPASNSKSVRKLRMDSLKCPKGWDRVNGNCLKRFQYKKSWRDAEKFCQSRGDYGHLASCLTANEMKYVESISKLAKEKIYMGYNLESNKTWIDFAGKKVMNKEIKKSTGECLVLNDGEYAPEPCNKMHSFFCKLSDDQTCEPIATCPKGWFGLRDKCYFIHKKTTESFFDAEEECQRWKANLVQIKSEVEWEFLKSIIDNATGITNNVWIGGRFNLTDKNQWSRNQMASISLWCEHLRGGSYPVYSKTASCVDLIDAKERQHNFICKKKALH